MKLGKCEFPGFSRKAVFALYKFSHDGTKAWGHFCSDHDRQVAKENAQLRKTYPETEWYDPLVNPELVHQGGK